MWAQPRGPVHLSLTHDALIGESAADYVAVSGFFAHAWRLSMEAAETALRLLADQAGAKSRIAILAGAGVELEPSDRAHPSGRGGRRAAPGISPRRHRPRRFRRAPRLRRALLERLRAADLHLRHQSRTMGWAIPAAVGVQCARPDRRVAVITGDGCMQMHGIEVQTAARYRLPIVYVVINNSALGNVW